MEMLEDLGEVSMSADILEMYREYAVDEMNKGKEDFLSYSELKEENKEVLQWK